MAITGGRMSANGQMGQLSVAQFKKVEKSPSNPKLGSPNHKEKKGISSSSAPFTQWAPSDVALHSGSSTSTLAPNAAKVV